MDRREFLVSAAALGAASVWPSIYGLCTGSVLTDDRAFQARSNSVMWDQDRWKPWVIKLADDDVTHMSGYNAELSGKCSPDVC